MSDKIIFIFSKADAKSLESKIDIFLHFRSMFNLPELANTKPPTQNNRSIVARLNIWPHLSLERHKDYPHHRYLTAHLISAITTRVYYKQKLTIKQVYQVDGLIYQGFKHLDFKRTIFSLRLKTSIICLKLGFKSSSYLGICLRNVSKLRNCQLITRALKFAQHSKF